MNMGIKHSAECWLLPEGVTGSEITARLQQLFRRAVLHEKRQHVVLHDTFAWQLWQQGTILCQLEKLCVLCHNDRLTCDEAIAESRIARTVPRFWWDWPVGSLRESLRTAIGPRALIPVAEVQVTTQRINLQREDEKTAVRVVVQHYRRPGDEQLRTISTCHLIPIRGQEPEAARVRQILQEAGYRHNEHSPLELVLEQSGRRPQPWSSQPALSLSPATPMREALRQLAEVSLETCARCEDGIANDLDTEFLHDYRISLRRLRAALKLLKNVYPDEVAASGISELGTLTRLTNRLRDLDVSLLNSEDHLQAVPMQMVSGLSEMLDDLRRERSEQQQQVAARLRSADHRELMQRLRGMFELNSSWPAPPNSHAPVPQVLNPIIPDCYRRIGRMIESLREPFSATDLHEIRLETKKLRYLLELFSACYPAPPMRKLIKRLKSMQDVIGTYHDLAVQRESLRTYSAWKKATRLNADNVLQAVNSLSVVLGQRQQALHPLVLSRLATFTSPEIQRLITRLFDREKNAA